MQRVEAAFEQTTGRPPKRMGRNLRFPCACCGGSGYKVSITEGDDGRVLLHCFGGCRPEEVLAAVGLRLGDLYMPRNWPQSTDERRRARMAIRQAGWASAFEVAAVEGSIVLIAGRQLAGWQYLSVEDDARLALAVDRLHGIREVFNGR